jgi:hypothetical protein
MQVPAKIRRLGRQRTRHCELPFPAGPELRVAQITATSPFDRVAAFPPERWEELEAYRPQVLVGPAAELQKLRERVELGLLDLKAIDHAVFVLIECGDKPLSDASRVVLWQTFGVPVYELFVGMGGVLLASECEAHEGWHVQPYANFSVSHDELVVNALTQKTQRTGLLGSIETAGCPCGRPGKRVMGVETVRSKTARHELAATA